jgi:hypothetical protein
MNKSGFELNRDTVGQLLKSQEIADACMSCAQGMAQVAGVGYEAKMMGTRVIVVSVTEEAEQDNLNNNTLLKLGR